jgi:hypothetical protein
MSPQPAHLQTSMKLRPYPAAAAVGHPVRPAELRRRTMLLRAFIMVVTVRVPPRNSFVCARMVSPGAIQMMRSSAAPLARSGQQSARGGTRTRADVDKLRLGPCHPITGTLRFERAAPDLTKAAFHRNAPGIASAARRLPCGHGPCCTGCRWTCLRSACASTPASIDVMPTDTHQPRGGSRDSRTCRATRRSCIRTVLSARPRPGRRRRAGPGCAEEVAVERLNDHGPAAHVFQNGLVGQQAAHAPASVPHTPLVRRSCLCRSTTCMQQ